jgi:hypothetical protein
MTDPTIIKITKRNGVAGQVQFHALVRYEDEQPSTVSFVGNPKYGGPVVMMTEHGGQTFVTHAERFGDFGEQWVRKFFTTQEGEK